jgi:phosphate transport system protein
MREPRRHFHQQLERLETQVQDMGAAAGDLLDLAVRTIGGDDATLCDRVIAGDDVVDAYYLAVEQGVMDLFALQTPVAGDLRLLTALLHISLHLERIADLAVNIAKIVKVAWGLPRNRAVVEQLEEMGAVGLQMQAAAMDALARRDLALCRRLTVMDEPIDRLNRGMLNQVLEGAADRGMLEWGIAMHVVAREIERLGDHAVDIGEQVAYLVSGEFAEFTDASHPEVEHPELVVTPVSLPGPSPGSAKPASAP